MIVDLKGRAIDPPPTPRRAKREFEAAQFSRLRSTWKGTANSIDADLRGDIDRLRSRSRDLAANDPYARRFFAMVQANVVGSTGFMLQARAADAPDRPDELARDAIETAFARWARRGICDIRGQMSFIDLQRAIIKSVARDGEAIIAKISGQDAGNDDGFALQLLDSARLATTHNRAASSGKNAIVMGIEQDRYGRPVRYWLRSKADTGYSEPEPYSAADILHIYITDMPEQSRGLPWMHAAMLQLHGLKSYQDAAITAAQVGARNLGFFVTPDGDAASTLADSGDADSGSDAFLHSLSDTPMRSIESGEFGILPSGYDFKGFDPDYPHDQYAAFVGATLRSIASGLGVSYHALANDLSGVNFSSIRAGTLEERDFWLLIQQWFIDAFLSPVYESWLRAALMAGTIKMPNGSALPPGKIEKFIMHKWQGRRWAWVDPLKDMQATQLAISLGIMSPQRAAAQAGVSLEDTLEEIRLYEAMKAEKGIHSAPAAPATGEDNADL